MIVTFTANPSLDRTATLPGPLQRGAVTRLGHVTTDPGGKGVNVARVAHLAGHATLAVLPARPGDPLLAALDERGLTHRAVPVTELVRTNLTLTEPDGTTTKLNAPGAVLTSEAIAACEATLVDAARDADWVVLSGSLPPGPPAAWYAHLVRLLRPLGVRIAVDTSDAPLAALADALPASAPDLIKPNSDEIAQLTGADGAALEAAATAGDLRPIADAAQELRRRGVGAVLATLGGAGAVLVTDEGAWHATAPPVEVASTVGAGDSSLTGYVLAALDGLPAPERLRRAVAYGSAAASLAGTTLPRPDQTAPHTARVTALA